MSLQSERLAIAVNTQQAERCLLLVCHHDLSSRAAKTLMKLDRLPATRSVKASPQPKVDSVATY
jgi:hypothetical protein